MDRAYKIADDELKRVCKHASMPFYFDGKDVQQGEINVTTGIWKFSKRSVCQKFADQCEALANGYEHLCDIDDREGCLFYEPREEPDEA